MGLTSSRPSNGIVVRTSLPDGPVDSWYLGLAVESAKMAFEKFPDKNIITDTWMKKRIILTRAR